MRMRFAASFLAFGLVCVPAASALAQDRIPAVLRGSPSALARENATADRHRLSRIRDADELRRFIAAGLLVPVVPTEAYDLDPSLGEADPGDAAAYAHARPWVKEFLDDVLGEGYRLHGERFTVTSLVRTVAYQRVLRRRYATAAGASGPRSRMSSHLTGSTVDIKVMGLSPEAAAWLRRRLVELERRGAVQATEERWSSACFHVMVSPDFARLAHPAPSRRRPR